MLPVKIFSLADVNIDHNIFIENIKKHYDQYEYDEYLHRQNIITTCVKNGWLDFHNDANKIEKFYLSGDDSFFNNLPVERDYFDTIARYRKRLICFFKISHDGKTERFFPSGFNQTKAEKSENGFDFRSYPRIFKEAPDEMLDDNIIKLLRYFSSIISKNFSGCNEIISTIHFTIIDAIEKGDSSNSPEGIHQDGVDCIVSALVLERCNIKGGVSHVYYPDATNKILEVELQPGVGLFHQDSNSNIWHEVTKIHTEIQGKPGYRSTIGFDFEIVR